MESMFKEKSDRLWTFKHLPVIEHETYIVVTRLPGTIQANIRKRILNQQFQST